MKEPTKKQIKEFWEWCGFRQNTDLRQDYHYELTKKVGNWHSPDGLTAFDQIQKGNLPAIDLNNLFKYAVPKLNQQKIAYAIHGGVGDSTGKHWIEVWFYDSEVVKEREEQHLRTRGSYSDSDPALALFWAIWEVLKEVNHG